MAPSRPSPADHGRSELRDRPGFKRAFERERKRLGKRLRKLRSERELTQEQAAEVVGLSEKHLRRIELGQANVTLATLVAFAQAFGLGLPELLEGH